MKDNGKLVFTGIRRYSLRDHGRIVTVANPTACDDFDHLLGRAVEIDGKDETILAVERFAHAPPFKKGEEIGLLLKNDGPANPQNC